MTYQIDSTSLDSTEQFAAALGARLVGGEIIVLVSDLGGGKTAFVRGLARGIGSKNHVSSPTFTVSREYQAGGLTLYHFDFYRLTEPGVVAAELAEFIDDPAAIIAIEWGSIVENILPADYITLHLVPTGDTSRTLKFTYPPQFSYLFEEKA